MLSTAISQFIDFLILTIGSWGYLGILIAMIIESSFLPLPGELILIPAGVLIYRGEMSPWIVLVMGVVGSIIGALINYFIAISLGRRFVNYLIKKYGKIFFLNYDHVLKTEKYFDNHGEITTFTGRLIPVVRHLISIPAGFAKMNLGKFILYTGIGSLIYVGFTVFVGYLFGKNIEILKQNMNVIAIVLVAIALIVIVVYVIVYRKKKN